MKSEIKDLRFPIQHMTHEDWMEVTINNASCDFLAGNRDVVSRFLAGRKEPIFKNHLKKFYEWPTLQLEQFVSQKKSRSIQFLVLMLTGGCNADCPICFTDRKKKKNELNINERRKIISEAAALGAKYIYVPGEGEPTIDSGFWDFLEACKLNKVEAVVFTNGIVLSDEKSCQRYWDMDIRSAINKLSEYPVSFYFKLWSTDPEKLSKMMKINTEKYHFREYEKWYLPSGLINLLEHFPRERTGLEIVFERRNAEEVLETILPFANEKKLPRIMELVQHNGRIQGIGRYDPPVNLVDQIRPHLSFTSCTMATCKMVVTCQGYLSPRIAVLEHQIPKPRADVRTDSLYNLIHNTEYLIETRYQVTQCLCEEIPKNLLINSNSSVEIQMQNVQPF